MKETDGKEPGQRAWEAWSERFPSMPKWADLNKDDLGKPWTSLWAYVEQRLEAPLLAEIAKLREEIRTMGL